MSIKRIRRESRLTEEEAAKYDAIPATVANELPDLIARHHRRMACFDQFQTVVEQLKAAREAQGLSLADIAKRMGKDWSTIAELESGQRTNSMIDILMRHAEAVGKRLIVSLAEE
jgi:ribosome-binding protein aMBF1 (putative translation factor)